MERSISRASGVIFSILLFSFVTAQDKQYSPYFAPGEKLQYTGYYNWGFIWLDAGTVEFTVSDTLWNNKPALKLHAFGGSIPSYDWIYRIRENFVTYCDVSNMKPYYAKRHSDEGSHRVRNYYRFSYRDKKIYATLNNNENDKADTVIPLQPNTYDLLTAVYYARSLDFESLKLDEKVAIKICDEDKIYDLYVRYKGVESVYIKDLDKEVSCYKATVLLIEGTVFNEGENMTVWVTKDRNRTPVLIEAKILVGSVKAVINNAEGLLFPGSVF